MKRIFLTHCLVLLTAAIAVAQERVGIGTASPAARLHVVSIAAENGLLLEKPAAAGVPFLKLKDATRDLLWLHTNDTSNVFLGLRAGELSSGKNNIYIGQFAGRNSGIGQFNIGIGIHSQENNKGEYNTAVGNSSLRNALNVNNSTAIGAGALQTATGSYNTAVGSATLFKLTTGAFNSGLGGGALSNTTTGGWNTALGGSAMTNNITGARSTAVGESSLLRTTAAQYNTAVGYNAGSTWDYGFNNVWIGANTDGSAFGQFNVIAIGQGTIAAGSNVARFGNSATVSYGGWAGWTNVSDGRFKTDVQENVPGLAFINQLKPVTYYLAAGRLDAFLRRNTTQALSAEAKAVHDEALQQKETVRYSGFIAQDVEAAAVSLGFDFSGVDQPKTGSDAYGLRYAEFVVPLVKAVQEQQEQIERLKKELEELKALVRRGFEKKVQ